MFIFHLAFKDSMKGDMKMLTEIVMGLSLIASAIAALTTEIYAAKKVSSISAGLNHSKHQPLRGEY